jgi:hypothetical protein
MFTTYTLWLLFKLLILRLLFLACTIIGAIDGEGEGVAPQEEANFRDFGLKLRVPMATWAA